MFMEIKVHAEAHNRELAIVKRLRDADGEEDGSNTGQEVADHYQPTSRTGQVKPTPSSVL